MLLMKMRSQYPSRKEEKGRRRKRRNQAVVPRKEEKVKRPLSSRKRNQLMSRCRKTIMKLCKGQRLLNLKFSPNKNTRKTLPLRKPLNNNSMMTRLLLFKSKMKLKIKVLKKLKPRTKLLQRSKRLLEMLHNPFLSRTRRLKLMIKTRRRFKKRRPRLKNNRISLPKKTAKSRSKNLMRKCPKSTQCCVKMLVIRKNSTMHRMRRMQRMMK